MTYRLYFNRCEDWPQIWSIDCGDERTEINVVAFRCEHGVTIASGRAPDFAAVDTARAPKAWCEIDAHSLRIIDGVAVFRDALADV